jgi:hypothetical protein
VAASALLSALARYLSAGESSSGSLGPAENGPVENGPVLEDIQQA